MIPRLRSTVRRARAYAAIALQGWGLTRDRTLGGPLFAQISICDPCNHRCVMCPYHPPGEEIADAFGGAPPGVMELDVFRALVDDLVGLGTQRVDLVGRGEPLLNARCIEMIAFAKRQGLMVAVTTNGARLTPERSRALVEARLDELKVSLNAGKAETYPRIHVTESPASYRATKANVARLIHERRRARVPTPHVSLSFTISAINAVELSEMIEAAAEVGADAAWFQHVIDPEGGLALDEVARARLIEDGIPRARRRARELGVRANLASFAAIAPPGRDTVGPCHVGSYFTSILGNGQVMPCCQTKRPLGSLRTSAFSAVWRGERYRAFRSAARRLPARSAELATCECDQCYFRPHNESVERALHPLRTSAQRGPGLVGVEQLLRMSRQER
jgi:MoaA/NifB/PqqE/SkfB family radical SAM enzyme